MNISEYDAAKLLINRRKARSKNDERYRPDVYVQIPLDLLVTKAFAVPTPRSVFPQK